MPLRQAMKTQQQVIVILLQVRLGAGDQCIEVFRLIVKRLQHRQVHVESVLANHPLGFFDYRSGGAVGELWIKRRQGNALVPGGDQLQQFRFNRRLAVTHGQFHRAMGPLGGHLLLQTTAQHHQRRTLLHQIDA